MPNGYSASPNVLRRAAAMTLGTRLEPLGSANLERLRVSRQKSDKARAARHDAAQERLNKSGYAHTTLADPPLNTLNHPHFACLDQGDGTIRLVPILTVKDRLRTYKVGEPWFFVDTPAGEALLRPETCVVWAPKGSQV